MGPPYIVEVKCTTVALPLHADVPRRRSDAPLNKTKYNNGAH